MKISEIFRDKSADVITLQPEHTIAQAARVMADYRVGLLVVCTEGGRVVGVLSERDVVRGVADYGEQTPNLLVAHLQTSNPITCSLDDDPREVLKTMNQRGFRHMPVVEHGSLVGIVSIKDVLKYMLDESASQDQAAVWSQLNFL